MTIRSSFMDTGTANAIVIVPVSPLTITTIPTGTEITVMMANSNTGATTLSFGGIVKSVVRPDLSTLVANDVRANQPFRFYYNGTEWLLYLGLTNKILSCNPRNSALVGASSDASTLLDITLGYGLQLTSGVLFCTI